MSGDQQQMVTLTIDGREVTVPKGTLVIRAAEQLGIYIPRFCDHPRLEPVGACRQCLVEVEGQRKPLTSCTLQVADGMVVKTELTSEFAQDAQKAMLEFLLINHPLDCPQCDKGGECPLQDQALAYGPGGSRYVDPKRRFTKPVPISPLIRLDRERCVLCARCTRFADQISGAPFIELFERSALEQVAVFEDEPYLDVFSGNVAQICPVGALTSQSFRFHARPFDLSTTPSTCTRCSSGCSIDQQERRGRIVRILAREDDAVNESWICDKGRYAFPYAMHPDRITEPLVRKGDDLVAVSWMEALRTVADAVTAAREAGRRIGVLGGPQLADEDSYALSRFARTVLGTNDVDFRLRGGSDEEEHILSALPKTITATSEDIDRAKLILVVGTDLREESPIVYLRVRKAWRRSRSNLVEIAPRGTWLQWSGARWIPCTPGGEASVLAGLARALDIDTGGFEGDATDELVGLVRDAGDRLVILAGDRLATTPGALTLAWNIAAATGGRFGWIPRKAGARGAVQAGLHPALLPGGRSVRWEPHRAQLEELWGVPVPQEVGRDTRGILAAASEYGVLFVAGMDPARDFADATLATRAFDDAPFVVAHDLFLTATSRRADVVLPAAAPYERTGSISNWEGRAQPLQAVIPPAGISFPDAEILIRLAEVMGAPFPRSFEELRDEMARLTPQRQPAEPFVLPRPPSGGTERGTRLLTYPLLLDSGTMMLDADELQKTGQPPFVEVHPDDVGPLGLADGDLVRVSTAHGTLVAPLRLGTGVEPGGVFVPMRNGELNAAVLLGADDPFPIVRVEKA